MYGWGHSVENFVISAVRSVGYRVSDWVRLRLGRVVHGWMYAWPLEGDPLVSIYIPTHNRLELLRTRSLPSILKQTYWNFEVIVCAHDCTDGTVEYIEGLKDSRIRVVEVPRVMHFPHKAENYWFSGRVDPSNAGLRACRGEWIATNDDDDVWTPDHLERLLKLAYYQDWEFISGGATGKNGPIEPYNLSGVKVGGVQTWVYRSYLKTMRFNRQSWRKSWNRVCDTDIQQRFRDAGVRMGYLNRSVCDILPRPGETDIGLKAYVRDAAGTENHFKAEGVA
jgi:glycosyltransferase involved in cell wall biosynthesis